MTKKKNCTDCGACVQADVKFTDSAETRTKVNAKQVCETNENSTCDYGFYSNVLKKPFDTLDELRKMEAAYFTEQQVKADKAAQKKADAKKVEDAFKALNAARKAHKDELIQLTKEYAAELDSLKKAYELGKKDIHRKLAEVEDAYSSALKEFTAKYDNFHMTLKDSDFETTISGSTKTDAKQDSTGIFELFDWFFSL